MKSAVIKVWMKAHNFTQQEMAERIGYTRTSVCRALAKERAAGEFWKQFSLAFPEAAAELLMSLDDAGRS